MLEECYCQHLNPADWHKREQNWEKPRCFYRFPTRLLLHSPLTYNEDISRGMLEAKTRGYLVAPNSLILLKSGLFRGELLIEVNPPVGRHAPHCLWLQGRFYTFISDAPLSRMGEVMNGLLNSLNKEGKRVKDIYLCLLTCPPCAAERGPSTIILAHLR